MVKVKVMANLTQRAKEKAKGENPIEYNGSRTFPMAASAKRYACAFRQASVR